MIDFEKVYFRSKIIGKLSSENLNNLKSTLLDIENKKSKIECEIQSNKKEIESNTFTLSKLNWFPIKFFFKEKIKETEKNIHSLTENCNLLKEKLEKHQLGLEINISDRLNSVFSTLCDDFLDLSSVDKIWDKTTSKQIDNISERTTATSVIERKIVKFNRISNSRIISDYKSLHFENANGHDLDVYPQFILIEGDGDFALVDISDVDIDFHTIHFIEEEDVPADSVITGKTWKKSNKDGSRDKRFVDNYEIPIVQYGELHIKSSSGINEIYMFSNPEPALTFKIRFDEYKLAISRE